MREIGMALSKGFKGLLVAWGISVAAAACAHAGAGSGDLVVVATIKPIHSLLTRLMDGVGKPTLLVEGAASPHTFALKPSAVRAISDADVFVRVSGSVEPFTRKIVKSLPQSVEVVTLMETPGVELLPLRGGGLFDVHRHGDDDADHHGEGNGHAAGDIDGMDGHIWLDPQNAKAIVSYLADVLAQRAPEQAARLKENARRLNGELDALAASITTQVAPLKDKPFVVFHDAYQYFDHRFGLDAVGSITVSPEIQPSARRLTELRQKIRTLGAVCVFSEPLFQPNLVAAVTEGTNVRSGVLDPEGSLLEPGGELYFKLMQNIAGALKTCLERPS